jgi:hypothetical protein
MYSLKNEHFYVLTRIDNKINANVTFKLHHISNEEFSSISNTIQFFS